MRRRISLFAWILPLFLTACNTNSPAPVPVAVAVQITKVRRQSISEVVRGGGTIYPLQQASLSPKISSPVKVFYVNRGDRVHRGQLLAILENGDLVGAAVSASGSFDQAKANYTKIVASSLPEQLQAAEHALQNADSALNAQQKLYESYLWLYQQHAGARKQVDQAEVALVAAKNQQLAAGKLLLDLKSNGKTAQTDAAKGQVESARGQFLSAQAQFDYTHLRSPIDGVVADRSIYPGDIALAGTPLFTIMDVSHVIVRLHLPHPKAALLKLGDPGQLHIPGIKNAVEGKIVIISPALDPNSTTVEVWVAAPNIDNNLQPGTSVQVDLVARVVPDAIVVPVSAVLTDSDGAKSVMLVTSDLKAHRQAITTEIENNGVVQILSGLRPGEEIIATGAYGLPDNTRVKPMPPSSTAQSSSQP